MLDYVGLSACREKNKSNKIQGKKVLSTVLHAQYKEEVSYSYCCVRLRCCVIPPPALMYLDAQFSHNLPINARQMHVMLLCAEPAGSAQAMR